LGVQSTTGDHHDQQAKKEGKQERKKASKWAECAEGRPITTGGVIGLVPEAASSPPARHHDGGSILIRRRGRPPMKLDAALDTSAPTTAICVVNSRDGAIVLETTVPTNPKAIFQALEPFLPRLHLVGHEATGWSAWLQRELEARGVPMVLLETHHTARMLEAQRNKTDKNDARGLAQIVRSGWFKPVHAKSDASNRMKLLLAHRRTLKRKLMDIENEIRQSLKMFGLM